MKVFDLQCTQLHDFEGWFASEEDFQGQLARGLLACPLCNDPGVVKRLSAPRLNLGAPEPREESSASRDTVNLQAAWLRAARELLTRTEDVGERFPEVARQMHYGETAVRDIRGKATAEQAEALIDEGIPVLPVLLPDGLKEPMQ